MRSQVRKMLSDNLSIEFRIMSACPIFWIKLPMFFKSYIRHNLSGTLCKKVKIHPSVIHILLSLTAKFLCLLMNLSKQMQRNRKSWNWQGECSTCQKKSEANCMEMCESQKQSTSGDGASTYTGLASRLCILEWCTIFCFMLDIF